MQFKNAKKALLDCILFRLHHCKAGPIPWREGNQIIFSLVSQRTQIGWCAMILSKELIQAFFQAIFACNLIKARCHIHFWYDSCHDVMLNLLVFVWWIVFYMSHLHPKRKVKKCCNFLENISIWGRSRKWIATYLKFLWFQTKWVHDSLILTCAGIGQASWPPYSAWPPISSMGLGLHHITAIPIRLIRAAPAKLLTQLQEACMRLSGAGLRIQPQCQRTVPPTAGPVHPWACPLTPSLCPILPRGIAKVQGGTVVLNKL